MTLKQARELLGISQAELDRDAGVPRGTVNDIERGRNLNPSATVAIKVVQALRRRGLAGASVESLFLVEV